MKKLRINLSIIVLVALAVFALAGCEKKTAAEKVNAAVSGESGAYALNAEERQRAMTNAKAHFEKEWPTKDRDGNPTKERGFVNLIRPTDSNTNGMVSAIGTVPQINGGYKEVKVYCGYRPELNGCSDEDTVVK